MKVRYFSILFFALSAVLFGQRLETETIFQDKISIRAIEIYDGKVWYSGTGSKFGYVSLKNSQDKKQIQLSAKNLQFRTLAQDRNSFYTINIESPAQFFRIDKNSLNFEVIHSDTDKNAFYDALHSSGGMFYAFSDPEENHDLKFIEFNIFGGKFISKTFSDPKINDGEAAFAASNTNITSSKNYIWLATGGKSSRILRLDKQAQKFEVFSTPFIQGNSSQGIYSIDFYKNKFGIAVGGDYTKQSENINNIATTFDAGRTWHIQASGKNSGYKTCVKIRPGSNGKEIIAVGDQNIEFSADFGKTWTKISDEKNLYTCTWLDRNSLVFAGKDRIVKARLCFK